ncbi:MAG: hypothetical protein ACK5DD_10485 [Cyclobacteriaceae bacterium]|jgi:hypothetical protein
MMRVLLLIVGVMLARTAGAQQFPFEYWHEGKLVLEAGDTLKGLIKYDLQTDLIQIQYNKKAESYTARKVIFCEIFDATARTYRQFYSLPYALNGTYRAPVFFELLSEGKLTVLVREAVEYRTYNSMYFYGGTYTRLVLVYKYFSMKENGEIEALTGKKSEWLDSMGGWANDVQKYAKANRLDFDDRYDLKRILDYYNSLFKKR